MTDSVRFVYPPVHKNSANLNKEGRPGFLLDWSKQKTFPVLHLVIKYPAYATERPFCVTIQSISCL